MKSNVLIERCRELKFGKVWKLKLHGNPLGWCKWHWEWEGVEGKQIIWGKTCSKDFSVPCLWNLNITDMKLLAGKFFHLSATVLPLGFHLLRPKPLALDDSPFRLLQAGSVYPHRKRERSQYILCCSDSGSGEPGRHCRRQSLTPGGALVGSPWISHTCEKNM